MPTVHWVQLCTLVVGLRVVRAQGAWDYDYSVSPQFRFQPAPASPLFARPFLPAQPEANTFQPVPLHFIPPQLAMQAGRPIRLTAPEYRNGDLTRLGVGRGFRDRSVEFGEKSSHLDTFRGSNEPGDLDSILARLAQNLPSIAEKMLLSSQEHSRKHELSAAKTFTPWDGGKAPASETLAVEKKMDKPKPADVVNAMPDPQAFFSFGKLISALTGASLDEKKEEEEVKESEMDVENIKGIPIMKDSDVAVESIAVDETLVPNQVGAESSAEADESGSHEFVDLSKHFESTTTSTTTTAAPNLLGDLLVGKLDKVDWMGSIFQKSDKAEGNALDGLWGNGLGGLLGPAMDSPRP